MNKLRGGASNTQIYTFGIELEFNINMYGIYPGLEKFTLDYPGYPGNMDGFIQVEGATNTIEWVTYSESKWPDLTKVIDDGKRVITIYETQFSYLPPPNTYALTYMNNNTFSYTTCIQKGKEKECSEMQEIENLTQNQVPPNSRIYFGFEIKTHEKGPILQFIRIYGNSQDIIQIPENKLVINLYKLRYTPQITIGVPIDRLMHFFTQLKKKWIVLISKIILIP